jgi:hypothetical protein
MPRRRILLLNSAYLFSSKEGEEGGGVRDREREREGEREREEDCFQKLLPQLICADIFKVIIVGIAIRVNRFDQLKIP